MVKSSLYSKAVEKFGKDHQLLVTVGELSELSAEISNHLISTHKSKDDDIVMEIADVCIMLEQCKIIFGEDKVDAAIRYKLTKVQRHING